MGIFDKNKKKKPEEKPLNSVQDVLQDANAWLNKGISAAENGSHVEAQHCFDKALELNPRLTEALYRKGLSITEQGDHLAAMFCFDEVLEIEPNHAEAWLNKGLCMDITGVMHSSSVYIRGKWEKKWEVEDGLIGALTCYNKALEINPKLFIAWVNKGAKLILQASGLDGVFSADDEAESLELYQNALECCNRALELAPEFNQSWKVWSNKGAALEGLGKYKEAIECYDKSLEINQQGNLAWHGKGRCLEKLERYQEAIECCAKALEISPKNVEAWHIKGVCLEKLGEYQEAKEAFERFIKSYIKYGTYILSLDQKGKQAKDAIKRIKKMKLK